MSLVIKHLRSFSKIGLGHYSRIYQNCDHKLSQIKTLDPMLVRVVQGSKIVSYQNKCSKISAGQLLIIPAGSILDITNLNSHDDLYLADSFTWSQDILKQFELSRKDRLIDNIDNIKIIASPSNSFNLSIDYAINLIQDLQQNNDLIFHQFIQLLRCLESENIYFSSLVHEKFSHKVERLIIKFPMQKWQAPIVAKHFAMSESTLRRHLSNEGKTLSNILFETRMSQGLYLLQTTHLNITQIAHEVGYDSGSRFATYFRKRFGFSPKAMRK